MNQQKTLNYFKHSELFKKCLQLLSVPKVLFKEKKEELKIEVAKYFSHLKSLNFQFDEKFKILRSELDNDLKKEQFFQDFLQRSSSALIKAFEGNNDNLLHRTRIEKQTLADENRALTYEKIAQAKKIEILQAELDALKKLQKDYSDGGGAKTELNSPTAAIETDPLSPSHNIQPYDISFKKEAQK